MPRVNPLPKRELEICGRLTFVRKLTGLSREGFGFSLFDDAIKRVELGRVPLRYELATRIWTRTPEINPLYLALGEGPPMLEFGIFLPTPFQVRASAGDLFSSVIEQFSDDLRTLFTPGVVQRLPMSWIAAQRDLIALKKEDADAAAFLLVEYKSRVDHWEETANLAEKKRLTNITDIGNTAAVKSKLSPLLARLNTATSERGMKSVLAKYMKVPLPNVSQWLSGEREPSGETTLQLLHWVEERERQGK